MISSRVAYAVARFFHRRQPARHRPSESRAREEGSGTGSGRSIFTGFKQVRQAREAAEYLRQFLASERLSWLRSGHA